MSKEQKETPEQEAQRLTREATTSRTSPMGEEAADPDADSSGTKDSPV